MEMVKKRGRRGNELMGQAHVFGLNQKTQDRT